MTSYWDEWDYILSLAEEGKIKDVNVFLVAIGVLIQSLHEYEHAHGGHVLDIYLEKNKYLTELKKRLLESVKRG